MRMRVDGLAWAWREDDALELSFGLPAGSYATELPTAGSAAASRRLDAFLERTIADYAWRRDLPAHDGTSRLSPHLRFGVAFCEASGPRLVRRSGNDDELVEVAVRNALAIGAGHCLVVLLRGGFPVSVLNALKQVPEVCRIYCATANPLEVVLAQTAQGRAVLGVVDGESPTGVETAEDVVERKQLLRRLGYRD